MRTLTITLMYVVLLVTVFNCWVHAAEEVTEHQTNYLQADLYKAWKAEMYGRNTIGDQKIAQAEVKDNFSVENEYVPQSVGAGGYGDKDWHGFVALYLWFVGMNGEVGTGENVADVDVSFGDIWDNLDFGIQAHVELWWKRLILFVDPMYMKVSAGNSNTGVIGTLRSDVEINMFLMDLAAGYRLAEVPLGSSTKSNNIKIWPSLAVDIYGGGRLIRLDSRLDLTLDTPVGVIEQRIKTDETWFDFIVGGRLLFDLTENLLLNIKSDIGGFGLGFSSDIDWNFAANIGYQLPWWNITPYLGYRVLYLDYDVGSGSNRFVYDVWHTGPQVGVGIRF